MSRIRVSQVTVKVKNGRAARIAGIPAEANGRVDGPEGENISVSVNRGNTQDEKISLLLGQIKVLDTRLANMEGVWYRRLWKFLNKKRRVSWSK